MCKKSRRAEFRGSYELRTVMEKGRKRTVMERGGKRKSKRKGTRMALEFLVSSFGVRSALLLSPNIRSRCQL